MPTTDFRQAHAHLEVIDDGPQLAEGLEVRDDCRQRLVRRLGEPQDGLARVEVGNARRRVLELVGELRDGVIRALDELLGGDGVEARAGDRGCAAACSGTVLSALGQQVVTADPLAAAALG